MCLYIYRNNRYFVGVTLPRYAHMYQVRSVCLSADGTKVLVGTLGSDILELAAVEKQKNAEGEDEGEEEEASVSFVRGRVGGGGVGFRQSRPVSDTILHLCLSHSER